MKVVVGLGNPGKNYERTVHNLGYMTIDHFADTFGLTFSKTKYFGKVAEGVINGSKVILIKPETFMNLSGKSVEDVMSRLKLSASDILVLADDIDIPLGALRIRTKGSGGTHNGLKDIVSRVGADFARIRIGVGKPPENVDLASFVLSRLNDQYYKIVSENFDKTDRIIAHFVCHGTLEGVDINKI